MKIKSIVVVGGGSSGWCSAAALAKFCPAVKITVVESDKIPTSGVGESTIQYFNWFVHLLGLQDEHWMKSCNATYKCAIKFTDFNEGHHYYAPFNGQYTKENDYDDALRDWSLITSIDPTITPDYFSKYLWNGAYLFDTNKITSYDDFLKFDLEHHASYNLDASKFGIYLRDHYCKPRGVIHYIDTIDTILKDNDGFITQLIGSTGQIYKGDLFIDCTGFSSMLLEKSMESKYSKYEDLYNDRAVVFNSIPYTDKNKEMEGYTNTIAKEYGWVWNIPLWNRISNGYVYSSKFTTDEEALSYLKKHVQDVRGFDISESQKAFYVDIKNGRHEKAWIKNVVGIGLSFGFIVPLGSTGLLLSQKGIIKLASVLSTNNYDYNSFDIESFNVFSLNMIDSFKDFYLMHFITTKREDTPYWKHIKYNVIPEGDGFKRIHKNINESINDLPVHNPIGVQQGPLYGMGYKSNTIVLMKDILEGGSSVEYGNKLVNDFKTSDRELNNYVQSLPTLFEFLSETIYKEEL